jgi:D-beta-D-heptose 7-phosphate kinase/D-beta-D-heptose 1-phosphate adenosyltransferase
VPGIGGHLHDLSGTAPDGPPPYELAGLLEGFSGLTVAVVGDAILDAYLDGVAQRLAREAPVPVVEVVGRTEAAGGAANVAVNVAALGARVRLISAVGRDESGESLLEIAAGHRLNLDGIVVSARRRTPAKRRILANGQMVVRFDEGTHGPLAEGEERRMATALTRQLRDADAVIVSDYGYGVVTDALVAGLASRRSTAPLVVDGRDVRRFRAARPAVCTPNFREAVATFGLPAVEGAARAPAVAAAAGRILRAVGADAAVVTLDRDGAVVVERDAAPHRVYAEPVRERSSTGAGDTFTAALTLALALSGDAAASAELAAAAATVAVTKPGTATCSPAELRLRLAPGGKLLADVGQLAAEAERHRREGRRIVLANGCFDILHRGHCALLARAKELGDVLVVAVNSDASVRRLKGSGRPINSVTDRIEILAALSSVDHVIVFDEDRPVEVLRALRPDLLVKGADYSADSVPEASLVRALGGEVAIVDLVPERSTTRIVERAAAEARP